MKVDRRGSIMRDSNVTMLIAIIAALLDDNESGTDTVRISDTTTPCE